ncbi:hypothetical protein HpMS212_14240 [Helicobacter pylori]
MTYIELGKKVLEQAERPLKPKEIWERACEMGLDKERPSIGKTPWSTIGSDLGKDKKQFYVAHKEKGKKGKETFFYWLNLVKENFLHKKPQMLKKKMMNKASV